MKAKQHTVTIKDVWSYISNKIASKVNDPFEELNGIIIPVRKDGTFGEVITSDEFDDVYDWLAHLCREAGSFETSSFGFMIPGWKKDPETMERVGQIVTFMLVNSYEDMQVGVWHLDTNEVDYMPLQNESNEWKTGTLPMALGALAVGIEIELGGFGKAGSMMREAKRLMARSNEIALKAMELIKEQSNH